MFERREVGGVVDARLVVTAFSIFGAEIVRGQHGTMDGVMGQKCEKRPVAIAFHEGNRLVGEKVYSFVSAALVLRWVLAWRRVFEPIEMRRVGMQHGVVAIFIGGKVPLAQDASSVTCVTQGRRHCTGSPLEVHSEWWFRHRCLRERVTRNHMPHAVARRVLSGEQTRPGRGALGSNVSVGESDSLCRKPIQIGGLGVSPTVATHCSVA